MAQFTLSTGNIAVASASSTVTASDGDSCTIKITASCYLTNGWVYSCGVVAKFYVDDDLKYTTTLLGNGVSKYTAPTKKSASYSYTVNRAHTSKTSKWRVDFWQATDGTEQWREIYINGSRTIAAQTSYTVKYNANGGIGAPANQTKWYGDTLTLRTTKPSRTGYTFKGWATSSTGSVAYSAGGSYTANAAATLYAVWSANTYTITLNGNGGTSSTQSATYGSSITLPTLTRTGYTFLGWATTSDATSATYSGGASYTVSDNKTLYAVWELAYWNPVISSVKAKRCNSSGTLDDYGTYLYVTFDFECCTLTSSSNALSKVEFEWTGDSTIDQTITSTASYITDGTTTSGSFGAVIGGSLDPEASCTLTTKITDTSGGYSTDTRKIGTADWPLDLLGVGNGAAFGKVAELEQFLDINYKLLVRDTSEVKAGTANTGAFIIGDIAGQHLAFDSNEVQAKTDGTTAGWFYLNKDGGSVWIGNSESANLVPGSLQVDGGVFSETAHSKILMNAMSVYCSSALTLSTSTQKLTLGTTLLNPKTSSLFTASDGGIKCNAAGYLYYDGWVYATEMTAGNALGLNIYRDSSAIGGLSVAQTGSRTYGCAHTSGITTVTAGQTIYLYSYNPNSATGTVAANSRTRLTLIYIG